MSEEKKPVDTTAGEAYERHIVPGMFTHWADYGVNWLAPKPGEHALDVACGTGIGERYVAKRVLPGGKVAGLDLDAGVVEVARRVAQSEGLQIEWRSASALEMPFPDGAFDLACCFHGIQFFPDRVKGFAEIRRVLKPSGRLCATMWGPIETNKGHHAMVLALESQKVDASAAKKACSFADTAEIRDAAARGGFRNVEVRTEDGVTDYASFESFIEGMTTGSPSTRKAIELLPANGGRHKFIQDVRAALAPYIVGGRLKYPMRTQVVMARP